MIDIELTGLRADSPIGAMAAFGCLRACQRSGDFKGTRLAWEPARGSFVAILRPPSSRTTDELVAYLLEDVKGAAKKPEFTWRTKLKGLTPDEFRTASVPLLQNTSLRDRETTDWFSAFGAEGALDREGNIDATPLDMTGGPQEFLAGVLELASSLSTTPKQRKAKTPEQAFREALFGPWAYNDDQHSLGWDPATIKLGAFTYKAPAKMANSGVKAAVWLAFESIPLFPCFSIAGRLGVRGFERRRREFTFVWPVWRDPISIEKLKLLLALDYRDSAQGSARGVIAIYRSQRFNLNKYYASFRIPELAFGGVAMAAV